MGRPARGRRSGRALGAGGASERARRGRTTCVWRACGSLSGRVRRGRGQAGGGRRLGVRVEARRRGLCGVGALGAAWRQGDHLRGRGAGAASVWRA
eukprot:scaffold6625_cov70-Phaeocystis_antarctica.AAC.1